MKTGLLILVFFCLAMGQAMTEAKCKYVPLIGWIGCEGEEHVELRSPKKDGEELILEAGFLKASKKAVKVVYHVSGDILKFPFVLIKTITSNI